MSLRSELQGGPQGRTGGGGMCHAVGSGGLRAETVAVHAGGKGCVCETVGDGNFKDGTMATPASDAKGSKVLGLESVQTFHS